MKNKRNRKVAHKRAKKRKVTHKKGRYCKDERNKSISQNVRFISKNGVLNFFTSLLINIICALIQIYFSK